MKAAVLHESPGRVVVADVQIDAPQPHEVLIRTSACGLCHTDLHLMTGDMKAPPGMILLGHEASGVVEAVGSDVRDIAPGDHVVACLSAYCGRCAECGHGRTWLCENRRSLRRGPSETPRISLDGKPIEQFAGIAGFAEKMLLHRSAMVKISKEIPLDLAALIGCAVITGVGSVVRGAQVKVGDTVAVIGIGGIGASSIQGAVLAGASRVIAVDIHHSQLQLARSLGATDVVDSSQVDAVEEVIRLTNGGVDWAFEAVGLEPTINQAIRMIRPGRTAYMVGVPPLAKPVQIPAGEMVLSGRGVQGLLMGSNHFPTDIPMLIDFYLSGRLNLDALIGDRIQLEDINDAYEAMRSGGHARPVIKFN